MSTFTYIAKIQQKYKNRLDKSGVLKKEPQNFVYVPLKFKFNKGDITIVNITKK